MRQIIAELTEPRIYEDGTIQKPRPVMLKAAKLLIELHQRLQHETQARIKAENINVTDSNRGSSVPEPKPQQPGDSATTAQESTGSSTEGKSATVDSTKDQELPMDRDGTPSSGAIP